MKYCVKLLAFFFLFVNIAFAQEENTEKPNPILLQYNQSVNDFKQSLTQTNGARTSGLTQAKFKDDMESTLLELVPDNVKKAAFPEIQEVKTDVLSRNYSPWNKQARGKPARNGQVSDTFLRDLESYFRKTSNSIRSSQSTKNSFSMQVLERHFSRHKKPNLGNNTLSLAPSGFKALINGTSSKDLKGYQFKQNGSSNNVDLSFFDGGLIGPVAPPSQQTKKQTILTSKEFIDKLRKSYQLHKNPDPSLIQKNNPLKKTSLDFPRINSTSITPPPFKSFEEYVSYHIDPQAYLQDIALQEQGIYSGNEYQKKLAQSFNAITDTKEKELLARRTTHWLNKEVQRLSTIRDDTLKYLQDPHIPTSKKLGAWYKEPKSKNKDVEVGILHQYQHHVLRNLIEQIPQKNNPKYQEHLQQAFSLWLGREHVAAEPENLYRVFENVPQKNGIVEGLYSGLGTLRLFAVEGFRQAIPGTVAHEIHNSKNLHKMHTEFLKDKRYKRVGALAKEAVEGIQLDVKQFLQRSKITPNYTPGALHTRAGSQNKQLDFLRQQRTGYRKKGSIHPPIDKENNIFSNIQAEDKDVVPIESVINEALKKKELLIAVLSSEKIDDEQKAKALKDYAEHVITPSYQRTLVEKKYHENDDWYQLKIIKKENGLYYAGYEGNAARKKGEALFSKLLSDDRFGKHITPEIKSQFLELQENTASSSLPFNLKPTGDDFNFHKTSKIFDVANQTHSSGLPDKEKRALGLRNMLLQNAINTQHFYKSLTGDRSPVNINGVCTKSKQGAYPSEHYNYSIDYELPHDEFLDEQKSQLDIILDKHLKKATNNNNLNINRYTSNPTSAISQNEIPLQSYRNITARMNIVSRIEQKIKPDKTKESICYSPNKDLRSLQDFCKNRFDDHSILGAVKNQFSNINALAGRKLKSPNDYFESFNKGSPDKQLNYASHLSSFLKNAPTYFESDPRTRTVSFDSLENFLPKNVVQKLKENIKKNHSAHYDASSDTVNLESTPKSVVDTALNDTFPGQKSKWKKQLMTRKAPSLHGPYKDVYLYLKHLKKFIKEQADTPEWAFVSDDCFDLADKALECGKNCSDFLLDSDIFMHLDTIDAFEFERRFGTNNKKFVEFYHKLAANIESTLEYYPKDSSHALQTNLWDHFVENWTHNPWPAIALSLDLHQDQIRKDHKYRDDILVDAFMQTKFNRDNSLSEDFDKDNAEKILKAYAQLSLKDKKYDNLAADKIKEKFPSSKYNDIALRKLFIRFRKESQNSISKLTQSSEHIAQVLNLEPNSHSLMKGQFQAGHISRHFETIVDTRSKKSLVHDLAASERKIILAYNELAQSKDKSFGNDSISNNKSVFENKFNSSSTVAQIIGENQKSSPLFYHDAMKRYRELVKQGLSQSAQKQLAKELSDIWEAPKDSEKYREFFAQEKALQTQLDRMVFHEVDGKSDVAALKKAREKNLSTWIHSADQVQLNQTLNYLEQLPYETMGKYAGYLRTTNQDIVSERLKSTRNATNLQIDEHSIFQEDLRSSDNPLIYSNSSRQRKKTQSERAFNRAAFTAGAQKKIKDLESYTNKICNISFTNHSEMENLLYSSFAMQNDLIELMGGNPMSKALFDSLKNDLKGDNRLEAALIGMTVIGGMIACAATAGMACAGLIAVLDLALISAETALLATDFINLLMSDDIVTDAEKLGITNDEALADLKKAQKAGGMEMGMMVLFGGVSAGGAVQGAKMIKQILRQIPQSKRLAGQSAVHGFKQGIENGLIKDLSSHFPTKDPELSAYIELIHLPKVQWNDSLKRLAKEIDDNPEKLIEIQRRINNDVHVEHVMNHFGRHALLVNPKRAFQNSDLGHRTLDSVISFSRKKMYQEGHPSTLIAPVLTEIRKVLKTDHIINAKFIDNLLARTDNVIRQLAPKAGDPKRLVIRRFFRAVAELFKKRHPRIVADDHNGAYISRLFRSIAELFIKRQPFIIADDVTDILKNTKLSPHRKLALISDKVKDLQIKGIVKESDVLDQSLRKLILSTTNSSNGKKVMDLLNRFRKYTPDQTMAQLQDALKEYDVFAEQAQKLKVKYKDKAVPQAEVKALFEEAHKKGLFTEHHEKLPYSITDMFNMMGAAGISRSHASTGFRLNYMDTYRSIMNRHINSEYIRRSQQKVLDDAYKRASTQGSNHSIDSAAVAFIEQTQALTRFSQNIPLHSIRLKVELKAATDTLNNIMAEAIFEKQNLLAQTLSLDEIKAVLRGFDHAPKTHIKKVYELANEIPFSRLRFPAVNGQTLSFKQWKKSIGQTMEEQLQGQMNQNLALELLSAQKMTRSELYNLGNKLEQENITDPDALLKAIFENTRIRSTTTKLKETGS